MLFEVDHQNVVCSIDRNAALQFCSALFPLPRLLQLQSPYNRVIAVLAGS